MQISKSNLQPHHATMNSSAPNSVGQPNQFNDRPHEVRSQIRSGIKRIAFMLCLIVATPALGGAPDSDGLVALVGQGYGWTEVRSIVKHVLDVELPMVIHESVEGRLAPEDFGRYRAVLVAGSLEEPYTGTESLLIENYVRGGGKLILIHQAPKNFYVDDTQQTDTDASYLFGRSYYMRDSPLCTVYEPAASLLEGALDENPDPFWLSGRVMLRSSDWQNLIGYDEYVLVGHLSLEQGHVYYLGHELFRLITTGTQQLKEHETEGWVRILKNVLSP